MSSTFRFAIIFLLITSSSFVACLKKDYEGPPDKSGYDPNLTITHTIEELLLMNGKYESVTGGDSTRIGENVWIGGIVMADDRSGNLFKRIVVSDSTAAITVLINEYSLYNDYPVGRKVYINCSGLYLGYDGGLPVIVAGFGEQMSLRGIEGSAVSRHIVKGNTGNKVVSDTIDMNTAISADSTLFNRLVTINDVQFADTGKSYTQPAATTNRSIMDCSYKTIVVRSSNYAKFATDPLPSGKGSITGIYTVYISSGGRATPQLVIRDTSDVNMYDARCWQ